MWEQDGKVEANKNKSFYPILSSNTEFLDTDKKKHIDECSNAEKVFPLEFQKIIPAIKGKYFIDFPRASANLCYFRKGIPTSNRKFY